MKTFRSVLIIVIILPLAVAILGATKSKEDVKLEEQVKEEIKLPGENLDINLSPEVSSRQLCFIWNTEAGDSAKLSMDLRGDKVIGELYWLPAEKDSKIGIFKGTVSPVDPYLMGRRINAIWETKAEGMTVNEELKIIFGEGTANVGFGEMKDRGDGVYVYANPDKLSYEPNLSDTDCGDEAMD